METTNYSVIWFIIGLVIFILEMVMPGLILMFFGIGAWVVAILTFFWDIPLYIQLLVFLTASLISLILLRKYFTRIFHGRVGFKTELSGIDEDIKGKRVKVIEKIVPPARGKVEFRGTNWTAEADEILETGDEAEIVYSKNLTLKVKSIK